MHILTLLAQLLNNEANGNSFSIHLTNCARVYNKPL